MQNSEATSTLSSREDRGGTDRERRQILVVDDDDDLRASVADVLRDDGFSVREAANGQAAIDYLVAARTLPRLILLDLHMPVMSGHDVIAVLRSDARLAAIPVLVVTGEPPGSGSPEGGTLGRLQKPCSVRDLLTLVRRHAGPPPNDDTSATTSDASPLAPSRQQPL